jgi:hypothetical protein
MSDELAAGQPVRAADGDRPKVEFLFWQDCPSHPGAYRLLQEVMGELGLQTEIERIEVLTDDDAERLNFPGSPTIRIDGADVDPAGAAQMGTALTCRIYSLEDGRISPVPSKEMVRQALSRNRSRHGFGTDL